MSTFFENQITDLFSGTVQSVCVRWFGQVECELVGLNVSNSHGYWIGTVVGRGLGKNNRVTKSVIQYDDLLLMGQTGNFPHLSDHRSPHTRGQKRRNRTGTIVARTRRSRSPTERIVTPQIDELSM